VAQWREERKYKVRPNTFQRDKVAIKSFRQFFGDERSLDSITKEDIEKYRLWRLREVNPSSVNRDMSVIAIMLDRAVELGFIEENPARKLKRLRDKRERQPRAMTREELRKFFEAARQNGHLLYGMAYPIFLTYFFTGMRRQELLYLEWEDLDFERRKIKIQAKIEKDGFVTKTGYAREVGMSKTLAEVLSRLPRRGRYVFGGDTPIAYPSSVSRAFRELREKGRSAQNHNPAFPEAHLHHLPDGEGHKPQKGSGTRRPQDFCHHLALRPPSLRAQ